MLPTGILLILPRANGQHACRGRLGLWDPVCPAGTMKPAHQRRQSCERANCARSRCKVCTQAKPRSRWLRSTAARTRLDTRTGQVDDSESGLPRSRVSNAGGSTCFGGLRAELQTQHTKHGTRLPSAVVELVAVHSAAELSFPRKQRRRERAASRADQTNWVLAALAALRDQSTQAACGSLVGSREAPATFEVPLSPWDALLWTRYAAAEAESAAAKHSQSASKGSRS